MRRGLLIAAAAGTLLGAALTLASWYCYPTVTGGNLVASQGQHGARGFGSDSARVDSQITLRIPEGRADEVYEYLRSRYVAKDDLLKDRFPDLHLYGQQMSDESVFTDRYFDTPALDLYRTRNSARHRTRINTTNPEDRKSGRTLVQMKVTPPGRFDLRSELKYEASERTKRPKSHDDLHPLIRLIPRDQRDDSKKVYADAGINPYALLHVLTITQSRKRGYLNWDDKNVFSFSVDQGSASLLWAKASFSSVDLGLVEVSYTEADEAKRKRMWEIRDAILEDLRKRFPELVENTESKYGIVLDQLMRKIPLLPALIWIKAV